MTLAADHPLAPESGLAFNLPDFAAITPAHFREAFDAGMAEALVELDALATDPAPPTAGSVLDAWERSGRLLERALVVFFAVKSTDTDDELDALWAEYAPRVSQHGDAIFLDARLHARLAALQDRARAGEVSLDAQESWLLEELLARFVRSGVLLPAADQERLRALNTKLAELENRFERANLDARNAGAVTVADPAELAGLSEAEIATLATAEGGYRIDLVNTSQHPLLEKLDDRGLRRRLFEASINRALGAAEGSSTPGVDTRRLIVDIIRARTERANLLGYPHHAALALDRSCAGTPERAADMLGRLAPAARAQAERDLVELRDRFAMLEPAADFAAWDWAYVAAKIRAERYVDPETLAAQLTPDRALAAVFDAAHRLYGLEFVPRPELRGHTAEADVYEVRDDDQTTIGAFVIDLWARPTKQGGAWMSNLVDASELLGERPVVTNNCNYTRGAALAWDDVITLFHEFGHALHGLLSASRYPSLSGTSTPRDFVEFPSQVNEHWAWEPGVIVSADQAAAMRAAERFNQGFGSVELFAAMVLDQAWHTTALAELPTSAEEVETFERAALEKVGLSWDLIPPRYRSTYFSHIWSTGYAAAYYSYVWAEVMDADAVDWFEANGGATRANGEYFRRTVLAPGGSVDVMASWRAFAGREPDLAPLLRRKGFA